MANNSQRTAAKVAGVAGLPLIVRPRRFCVTTYCSSRSSFRGMPWTRRAIFSRTKRSFVSRLPVSSLMTSARSFCATALYVILAPVNRGLALAGALFRLVFAIVWLIAPSTAWARFDSSVTRRYLKFSNRNAFRRSRECRSPQVSTITMLAYRSLAWPRPSAPGSGSSPTTSRADCRSSG